MKALSTRFVLSDPALSTDGLHCPCETMKLDAPVGSWQAALQFHALNQIMGKACPFQCSLCGPARPWAADEKEENPDDEARFYLADPVRELELEEEYLRKQKKEEDREARYEYYREEHANDALSDLQSEYYLENEYNLD